MLVYATSDDLKTWMDTDTPPDGAPALLRSASILIRQETRAARYDVDPSGKPSDPDVLQAFSDATCAQAAMWSAAKINPAEQGVGVSEPAVVSKSMGGRSVQYADLSGSVTVQQQRSQAALTLCEEARAILDNAGLLDGQPGMGDYQPGAGIYV